MSSPFRENLDALKKAWEEGRHRDVARLEIYFISHGFDVQYENTTTGKVIVLTDKTTGGVARK